VNEISDPSRFEPAEQAAKGAILGTPISQNNYDESEGCSP